MPYPYYQYPNFNQMYYQQQTQNIQQQTPQIQNGGFVFVKDINEARNYAVAPGNSVTFKIESQPYICTKYNSVSIGLSDTLSEQDIETCLRLIMTLKQRYDVENDNIVRQMDITGEHNPKTWHDMNKWKKNIKDKLIDFSFAKTTKSE